MITISESLVLVDAMIIIDLHELGLWPGFVASKRRIAVSSIVADEAHYYRENPGGSKKEIKVKDDAEKGLIDILEADLESMGEVTARFANWFVDLLHVGEVELIALLLATPEDELAFCSSDAAAISAVAMLGFSERCVCLERLLQSKGLGRQVEQKHTSAFMDHHLREGQQRRSRVWTRLSDQRRPGCLPQNSRVGLIRMRSTARIELLTLDLLSTSLTSTSVNDGRRACHLCGGCCPSKAAGEELTNAATP